MNSTTSSSSPGFAAMSLVAERPKLTIGTRSSRLALAQTALVVDALRTAYPTLEIDVKPITTKGDLDLHHPLRDIGDTGIFVAAIEDALLTGEIDLAVHSAKDLPSTLQADLTLVAFPRRADARDALISRSGAHLADLPSGARVGTSSVRRACQLRHLRPDIEIVDLRGNVDTRLRKLQSRAYDGIVLAKAGLDRLGLAGVVTEIFLPEMLIPAVAQGALALETRAADAALEALLNPLDDSETRLSVLAERAFAARLGGGCNQPVAAYAQMSGQTLTISGMLGVVDGRLVQASASEALEATQATQQSATAVARVGTALAEELLAGGGEALLLER
jgi:hydroxymethylbilane synthase